MQGDLYNRVGRARAVQSLCRVIKNPGVSHVSYTKWLAKYVLALRAHMSITAVAEFTGLHWDTVKNIEKRYLSGKYAKVSLRGVRRLGIDKVYLERNFEVKDNPYPGTPTFPLAPTLL